MSFFTTTFMATEFDKTVSQSAQGQLSSQYTSALTDYLKGSEVADWIGFLAKAVEGLQTDQALAVKQLVIDGAFTLDGLFGAAQSKTGPVSDSNVADPDPTLTVTLADSTVVKIDLTAILTGLDTETWTQTDTLNSGKKVSTITTFHTREFYTDGHEPEGYEADWAVENTGPIHEVSEVTSVVKIDGSLPGDTFGVHFDLLGSTQENVVLHFSGEGDFNWKSEGFTISGDALATLLGPHQNNSGSNPEALTFDLGPGTATVSASDYDGDGTVDLTVAFTSQTAIGSEVKLHIEYDYWI
jgi:hypothetical protein